jgi:hypothetical protein
MTIERIVGYDTVIRGNPYIQVQESSSSVMQDSVKQRLDVALADEEKSPADFVISLCQCKGVDAKIQPTLSCDKFQPPTEEQIELYDLEVMTAVREQKIEVLRTMHKAGRSLQCCNRFGESLLHMACRRGFVDVVKFMVEEANVSLYVRDDYGRTPMHDACWSPSPNFPLMKLLVENAPEQLFLSDVRGHTPLSYTRKSDWSQWKNWLVQQESVLRDCQCKV